MTGQLGKACKEPRCPNIVPDGPEKRRYCDAHKHLEETHRFDYRREPRDKKFYNSIAWRKCRESKLRVNPICEDCGRAAARVVHHIKQAKEFPELRFRLDNLEALCDRCHNRKSQQEARNG